MMRVKNDEKSALSNGLSAMGVKPGRKLVRASEMAQAGGRDGATESN